MRKVQEKQHRLAAESELPTLDSFNLNEVKLTESLLDAPIKRKLFLRSSLTIRNQLICSIVLCSHKSRLHTINDEQFADLMAGLALNWLILPINQVLNVGKC